MNSEIRSYCAGIVLLLLLKPFLSESQSFKPSLTLQSGMNIIIESEFIFSPLNTYFCGYNLEGEYVLWNVKTGALIKKITPFTTDVFTLLYTAKPVFSNDEKYLLLPQYPQGNYLLYDIQNDSIVNTFKPPFPEEKYTDAFFSKDQSKVMLVAQVGGDNPYARIQVKSINGEHSYKSVILNLPVIGIENSWLLNLVFKKLMNTVKAIPGILSIAASTDLERIWFSVAAGKLYTLNLTSVPDRELKAEDYTAIASTTNHKLIDRLSLYGNNLFAASKGSMVSIRKSKNQIKTDTLYVIDANNGSIKKKTISEFVILSTDQRANDIGTEPLTTGQYLNTYFKVEDTATENFTVICYDLLTDKELFRVKNGKSMFYYVKNNYQPEQLHGGYIVGISNDGLSFAECTREMVIHDMKENVITSEFSIVRGALKLNAPLFLDSTTLMIPKTYNDAFIINLKTAEVDRLKREISCQDTARGGANVFFRIDNTSGINIQNACLSSNKKTIGLINYIPNDLCTTGDNKTFELYDASKRNLLKTYTYNDPEYTYTSSMVGSDSLKYLFYYKLVDFSKSPATVQKLIVVNKKDTFFSVNPVYIPSINSIVGVCGTRKSPGDPTIIFAQWDVNGNMLKTYKYERPKSKQSFQTVITEVQFSPDSSKILFGLQDGTIGIFDIAQMKVIAAFEDGKAFENKFLKLYDHTQVMAGCFIDNDFFAAASDDGLVRLWSISQNKLIKVINKEPHMFFTLVVSPDKKYLVGVDYDKTVLFLNLNSGETDMRFVAFDYKSYAMIDKNGFYTSNKSSDKDLRFTYKGKSYEFSQFDLYLNRPDKIIETLGYGDTAYSGYYKRAYEKRLSKSGYKASSFTLPPASDIPEVNVTDLPVNTRETSSSSLSFSVQAQSESAFLDKLMISINGVPLYGINGMLLKNKSNFANIPVSVPLSSGENKIEVSVLNTKGIESLPNYININKITETVKPTMYVIAIGSGNFIQTKYNLKYPSKDAKDIITLFSSKANDYSKIIPVMLIDKDVTLANVLKLKQQLKQSKPDDYVILFYAGHGLVDKNYDYYLSTYNTDFSSPKKFALPYSSLENILDSIPARNKMMFIDACNSGEIDKESVTQNLKVTKPDNDLTFRDGGGIYLKENASDLNNSFKLMQTLFTDLRRSNGTSVMASAGAAEFAVEGESWHNGVFTFILQKALQEKLADINKDGEIYASELIEYMEQQVPLLTNGSQHPVSRSENIVHDMLIWR